MHWRYLFLSILISFASLVARPSEAQVANPNDRCTASINALDPLGRSPNVACTVPQVYGPLGLAFGGNGGPLLHGGDIVTPNAIQADFLLSLNTNVATQIALLPFVTPASGITLTFDKSLGVFTTSQDSFGPIFSERASTVGKNRLAVGFSYQYVNFDSLDGIDLHDFPTVAIQSPFPGQGCTAFSTTTNFLCGMLHDHIIATNRIDLRMNQYTTFVTFGLTRRLDLSVAVPVLDVRMAASVNATMVENSDPSAGADGQSRDYNTQFSGPQCAPNGQFGRCGFHATFSNAKKASGLGDLTVRVKANIRRWERAGLAAGVDVRIPTGNEMNFLGAGAVGIKPFAVWSYGGRLSPHANVGYQWNGQSVLGADVTTGGKANLPGALLYSAGVEAAVSTRFTAAVDLVGQRVFNGTVDRLTPVPTPGPCSPSQNVCASVGAQVTSITPTAGSYGINNASLGLRFRPFGKFLISASVQLKLDNGGLRSKAIPLVSATYTFH
jgi:hypothetical protein